MFGSDKNKSYVSILCLAEQLLLQLCDIQQYDNTTV